MVHYYNDNDVQQNQRYPGHANSAPHSCIYFTCGKSGDECYVSPTVFNDIPVQPTNVQ
jgi:hypothetical protein